MIKLFSFPPNMTFIPPSPSSIEDPTKLSSCLIFVSKFDNALLFNCIEKTLFPESSVPLTWPCPPWPSKRAEEADNPLVVDDSVDAEEGIDAVGGCRG
jgi:hypothetical protein